MADALPTTWAADPHTLAKHAILQRYLQAWFPILSRQSSAIARQYGISPKREILSSTDLLGPAHTPTTTKGVR